MSNHKNMSILIVDDSHTMRNIAKKILVETGYTNIVEADTGRTAILALREREIDLILLDWRMPEMNGLDTLKKIRTNPKWKDKVVVMITSVSENQEVIKALKEGANDYIVKPFQKETFIFKFGRILQKHFN